MHLPASMTPRWQTDISTGRDPCPLSLALATDSQQFEAEEGPMAAGKIAGEYDVVVVGAGNAGMCAALAAREHGVRVLVLEAATFDERGATAAIRRGRRP